MEKVKWILFSSAALLITIPILIVIITDQPFSSTFSNTALFSALSLIILGKLITVIQKKKVNKIYATDIGMIIGLFIVLLIRVI
ncbi:histidine kinase [Oceanobacillus sp. CAU 1775]